MHTETTHLRALLDVRRSPLAPVAVALIVGIVVGRYAPAPWGVWAVVGLVGLVAAAGTLLRPHLRVITCGALAVAITAASALGLTLQYRSVAEDHVIRSVSERSMPVTLRGRVASVPKARRGRTSPGYDPGPQTGFLLEVTEIQTGPPDKRNWQAASGAVRVTVSGIPSRLSVGRQVQLVGRIGRYGPPDNPGQFDFRRRGQREGVLAWMMVPSVQGATLCGESPPTWPVRMVWHLRAAARRNASGADDAPGQRLVAALVVGERDRSLRDLSRSMARAGVAHLLSISGLHLGIFLMLVFLLCRLAMLPVRTSAIVVLAVLIAYVLLAEPRAPLLRSAVMAAMLCAAAILGRPYTAVNALAAAAIILLAIDPLGVFDAGFQLSFGIVLGLLVLHEPLRSVLFARFYRRRGLRVFRNSPVRRWVYHTAAQWGIDIVTASLTAYMVAAPLVAYHFGIVSPYAAALSVLLLPLVVMVLVPGYLALAMAPIAKGLSYTLSRAAASAAEVLTAAISWAEHLPGLCMELRTVPVVWVLACYAAIVLGIVALVRRWRAAWVAAAAAAGLVAVLTVLSQRPAGAPPQLQLHLLAVGNGQAAILRTSGGRTVLLDAGRLSGDEPWNALIKPFLRDQRFSVPDAAIISHANVDHYSALPALLAEHPRVQLYVCDYFGKDTPDRPAEEIEQRMLDRLADAGLPAQRLSAGTRLQLDERTQAEVLWPPQAPQENLTSNDSSLVVRIVTSGASVLLCGDIGPRAQSTLLASGADLRADVLVLPHHGAWTPQLPDFVAAVNPKVVLVSGWGMNRGVRMADSHRAEFFDRLSRTRRCYTTATHGWICVEPATGGRWTVRTMHH